MNSTRDQVLAMSELIEAHLRYMRAAGMSPNTIRDRKRLLTALHEDLPFGLCYASTDELEDWLANGHTVVDGVTTPWSAWTLTTYGRHIRGFYRWADGNWLAGNPAAGMAKQRNPTCIPKPVTTEELQIALDRSDDPWVTAIHLAAFAGLRADELVHVRREDVTEERIWIRRAKGGDSAQVDTHPAIWELVRNRPTGPLMKRVNGKPVTARWLADRARIHFERLGLDGVTMHRFRHWFGTTLLEETGNLRLVQDSLRHKSVTSTQGYTFVAGGQRRLAIRSLPAPARHPREH